MSELKEYSLDEVKTHNKPDDLWVIIRGKVYDVSKFRHEHPGGSDVLEDVAGKDGTTDFIEVGHSKDAEKQMKSYLIGTVAIEKGTVDTKCIAIAAGAVLAGFATAIIIRRLIASSK